MQKLFEDIQRRKIATPPAPPPPPKPELLREAAPALVLAPAPEAVAPAEMAEHNGPQAVAPNPKAASVSQPDSTAASEQHAPAAEPSCIAAISVAPQPAVVASVHASDHGGGGEDVGASERTSQNSKLPTSESEA